MGLTFRAATKTGQKARIALFGPSGSGKTYTALQIAQGLGQKIAVVDTEHGSASKYADLFRFDTLELDSFSPEIYTQAIKAAASAGYDVVVIDSLSHAWTGKDGALELVDRASKGGNKFAGWRDVTPLHNELIDTIIGSPIHVIATMRSKTEYIVEQEGNRIKGVTKVGTAPVQRDGMEYEFDIILTLDMSNVASVDKTRCPALAGRTYRKDGASVAAQVADWLGTAAPAPSTPPSMMAATPPTETPTPPAPTADNRRNGAGQGAGKGLAPGATAAAGEEETCTHEGCTAKVPPHLAAGCRQRDMPVLCKPHIKDYLAAQRADRLLAQLNSADAAERQKAATEIQTWTAEIGDEKIDVLLFAAEQRMKAQEEPAELAEAA